MSRVRVPNLSISLDGFDTRPSVEMEGGTTCHFIDASPAEALETGREAAYGKGRRNEVSAMSLGAQPDPLM